MSTIIMPKLLLLQCNSSYFNDNTALHRPRGHVAWTGRRDARSQGVVR